MGRLPETRQRLSFGAQHTGDDSTGCLVRAVVSLRDLNIDVKVGEDSSVQHEVWGSPVRRKRSEKMSSHQNAEAETEVKPAPGNKLVKVKESGGHGGPVLGTAYRVETEKQVEELATELARLKRISSSFIGIGWALNASFVLQLVKQFLDQLTKSIFGYPSPFSKYQDVLHKGPKSEP